MAEVQDNLTLKWGSIKGWDCTGNEKMRAAMVRWVESGVSYSAMRRNTPEQEEMICDIIDACNGTIWNDWDGVVMTKDEAKEYVRGYGKKERKP